MKRRALVLGLSALFVSPTALGDELRNVKVGDAVPPIAVTSLAGGPLWSADLEDCVVVLVYVAAEQRSSERALQDAEAVHRELARDGLALVALTADVTRVDFFRAQRDRLQLRHPLGLDVGRQVQGDLGLFVYPTTIVIGRDGTLGHVISSHKSDYRHVLESYARHALGLIDDAELEERLTARKIERNRPEDRAARHRAAARILRERGMLADTVGELRRGLEIVPEDEESLLDLASAYIALERFVEAEQLVQQLATRNPEPRRNKLLRGVVLFHRDRTDEAKAVLEEALLLNPDPVWTHYYLGLIAERQGDSRKALEHFRASITRVVKNRPM